ncbi:aminodeoxychorismate/anthranilate synthase component II [Bengtsoniella intestinalis]|uniref:anthranilate synthase component II n=1 Tax=Bengtsoniella intestinalis TaxID=3073143 RepID=UPI00391F09D3
MILLIDNYDSFSYNLYQLIGSIEPDIKVIRNDELTVAQVAELQPKAIFLSPGPGRPEDAGICQQVAKELGASIPIFGVCLGHQAICQAYGGTVSYAKTLMHGKTSIATLDTQNPLFRGMEKTMQIGRYHSLSAVADTLPDCLQVIAATDDGEVMAIAHTQYPVYSVQFHPESVLTPEGFSIINNFLKEICHD